MAKYLFNQIAKECRETYKGDKSGVPIVGLEHIIPNEMLLRDYDVDTENTFSKSFKKGQILFGRRRAYQQKAAVATFDGICSGDITVIEAIPDVVHPDLLPFLIQNEKFFEHAIQGSAGSLSPRVKWEHLASFEVELPCIEEQQRLSEKLWTAYRLKENYKKLIEVTDEMVKSQFIEMFGTMSNAKYDVLPMVSICERSGQYGSNTSACDYIIGTPRYIRITDINDDGSLNDDVKSAESIDDKYLLRKGDLVFARTGATVGKTYLHHSGKAIYAGYLIKYHPIEECICPEYLFAYTHSAPYYTWVELTKKVGAQPNISATQYDMLPVIVPPIEKQREFVMVAQQADKSKFELKKSIEAIDKVIKSLINSI